MAARIPVFLFALLPLAALGMRKGYGDHVGAANKAGEFHAGEDRLDQGSKKKTALAAQKVGARQEETSQDGAELVAVIGLVQAVHTVNVEKASRLAILVVGSAPEAGSPEQQMSMHNKLMMETGGQTHSTMDEWRTHDPEAFSSFYECAAFNDICRLVKNLKANGYQDDQIKIVTSISNKDACYFKNATGSVVLGGGKQTMILVDCWEQESYNIPPCLSQEAVTFGVTGQGSSSLQSIVEAAGKGKNVLLHYIGHGDVETGGWYFEEKKNGLVNAGEILAWSQTWANMLIFSEACFGLGGIAAHDSEFAAKNICVLSPTDKKTAFGEGFMKTVFSSLSAVKKQGATVGDLGKQVALSWTTEKTPLPGRSGVFSGRSFESGGNADISLAEFFSK